MSEQPDQQVAQAADSALQEIARTYEHALEAVRHHYPALVPTARHASTEPSAEQPRRPGQPTPGASW